jgi:hypothetical protein
MPFPVRRALPFLPFRASVSIEWTDCTFLLCPLLTPAMRSEHLAMPSVTLVTHVRSPEVFMTAFCAQPPDLRSALLMDMDFVVGCPFVPRSRLYPVLCSSARAFAPRFLQTPPHDDALALR